MPALLKNTFKVARWELMKNFKSPTFLILTLVIPLLMVAGGAIGYFSQAGAAKTEQNVAVIDETGMIYPLLEARLADTPVVVSSFTPGEKERLAEEVKAGKFNGYMHMTEDSVQTGMIPYFVKDVREQNTMVLYEGLRYAVTLYRLQEMGLSTEQVRLATAPVALQNRSLEGEEASITDLLVPMFMAILLILAAMFSGQVLMYGVVKEKRNRIVEIILSSITALELLLGKIVGFAALGLLQIAIWLAVGLAVTSRFFDLRQLSLTPVGLAPSLLFFIGGYILFSSLFAAVGATMKDAEGSSQSQGVVLMVPMIPLFAASAIFMTPNALWVRVFSFLPPFIPVTMLLRTAAATLPWWEISASAGVLFVAVALFIVLAARVFERGILQYERTLSFKDIGRMLRKNYS